jgi:DNA primase
VYHPDPEVSTLAVSLLHFPFEESPHWKTDLSQASGFQKALFHQDYKSFKQAVSPGNEDQLAKFLRTQEDTTPRQVESAINYLKLRKIKRLLLQNQADLEKADATQQATLVLTHQHLKQMEMDLSKKLGSVVIK